MNEKMKKLVIGALLHDIGKLWQRGMGDKRKHGELAANVLEQAGIDQVIADCARYHHRDAIEQSETMAMDNLAYIVYEADNIAAGADRRENIESDEEIKSGGFVKDVALASVFNLLGEATEFNYSVNRADQELLYPSSGNTITVGQYAGIAERFNRDFKAMDGKLSVQNILKLCEKHLSVVPSATQKDDVPDISLYDHLKITAAVASCMLAWFEEQSIVDYKKACYPASKRNKEMYLLASADLSGVQDFIYTIASKGALKSLRARSFYLELFLEHIADEILEMLDLSRANLLYTGGGHFYILLPNTEKAKAVVQLAGTKINNWLFEEFGATLYLALACESCTAEDLKNESTKIFSAAGRKLGEAKLQKYADDPILLKNVFSPKEQRDCGRECSVCGTSNKQLYKWSDSDGTEACGFCIALFENGKFLLNENKYFIAQGKITGSLQMPDLLGNTCSLVFNDKLPIKRIYCKNKSADIGDTINLWMGDYNWRPENKTELADFSDYAERPKGGVKRLGCIRADVDNLGTVFSGGFRDPKKNTLTRISVLSRQLNLFFKWYINSICGKRRLAIVYSGGDDVFAIGAWDDVISFATDLRAAFAKYTCGKLTFSAGINLLPEKFPVWQMAAVTGELEEKAKANIAGKHSKDSLALFGNDDSEYSENDDNKKIRHVYFWNEFENKVVGEKQALFEDCFEWTEKHSKDKLLGSTAFLYKLKGLIHNRIISNDGLNIARLAYSLARIDPNSKNEAKQHCYERVRENVYKWIQDEQQARQLYTAIDLIIYSKRGGE